MVWRCWKTEGRWYIIWNKVVLKALEPTQISLIFFGENELIYNGTGRIFPIKLHDGKVIYAVKKNIPGMYNERRDTYLNKRSGLEVRCQARQHTCHTDSLLFERQPIIRIM